MFRSSLLFVAGIAAALAAGWLAFPRVLYKAESQPFQFSHSVHTGEKGGMKCEDCHSLRADGTFTGVPRLEKCAGCHSAPMGTTKDEKLFVERYVTPGKEVPWKVYSQQPDNAYFPHAWHVNLAKLQCERCHGDHGKTGDLRAFEQNRISGYSRGVEGALLVRTSGGKTTGMKMSDCEHCHSEKGVTTACIDCHK